MRGDVERSLLCLVPGGRPDDFLAQFLFDPALPLFAGHFPRRPLLPGVHQLEMVRFAAERSTGKRWRIARIARAKFQGAVLPGLRLDLHITLRPDGAALNVRGRLAVGDRTAATISLGLEPEV